MLHLVHAAMVHFPIALLVVGGLAEAFGLVARWERARSLGGALVVIGVVFLVATVASGYLAANALTLPAGAEEPLARHEQAALALLAVWLVLAVWKGWSGGTIPEGQRLAYAAALLVGVALTVATALLGGRLVYGWGVGVLAG